MGDTKPVKPLEEWIFESGLGQRSFAEKAGVSQTIISQLITGKRSSVKAETAGKIAAALGIEIRQVKDYQKETANQRLTDWRGTTRKQLWR
jgi:transcriptional regulator with XRE-family HTH domain